jgi:serine/threonine-protein kinase
MDFISRDALISAMNTWVLNKSKSIGQILREEGVLANDTFSLLEALVQKHLALHGYNMEKSLAAVTSATSIREELIKIPDRDVQASLVQLPSITPPADDPNATRAASIGALSSSGLRFRILRPHARGGLGQVSVALDEELHREVALKEIQGQHADHPESRGRFLLEAEITGGLEHPGIVPVYGLGRYADGRPFYAMRFIRGDNLKDAIERFHGAEKPGRDAGERALELRQLLGRFIDVCNAVAYAHSRGVLHRDLKPGNIMLGSYGETLVVDWGLAKPVDKFEGLPPSMEAPLRPSSLSEGTPTLSGSAMGTPQYMSPEQAAGRLDLLGPASDVYSLGATLYCLLTGRAPFDDSDVGAVLLKVQRGDFPRPRERNRQVPPALDAICVRAMALKPEDRYESPRALADDIEHWLADERVSAWREPWSVRTLRWVRRHRTLVAGAAAAVVVATASLAVATVLLTAANQREGLARELAVAREQEANEQRDEAEKQRQKAEENYQLARKAVDRYHTEISESVLLNEPGLQPLRKRLLEAAREFYQKFVDERSADAGVEDELGRAVFRLAQITGEIDSESKAIDLHREALQVFGKVAGGHRSTEEYQRDLASCYHHLGRLYRLTDQPDKAEESYRSALATWEELRRDHPTSERDQAEMARTQLGLGNNLRVMGKLPAAASAYEKSLATREELLKANPSRPEYRRDVAISLNNLGMIAAALGQSDKAKTEFRRAALLQEGLAGDFPTISQYKNDLARTNYNLGDLAVRLGETTNATEAYGRAVALWEKLGQVHPAVTEFQTNLAEAFLGLAALFAADKQIGKAQEACSSALAIRQKLARQHQNVPSYRGDLARCHFQIGNVYRKAAQLSAAADAYHACLEIQEKLASEYPGLPRYRGDLARSYNNVGLLYQDMRKQDDAGPAFQKALAIWDKLIEQFPDEPEFAVGAAETCQNLGMYSRSYAKFSTAERSLAEARRWYSAALSRSEKLSNQKRGQATVKKTLRAAHWGLADIFTQLRHYPEAIQEWDLAIDLDDQPGQLLLRSHRALTRARSGDYTLATAEADELSKQAAQNGDLLFLLGRVYCVSAAAVEKDPGPAPKDKKSLRERYLASAGTLLERARQTGYFKSVANLDKLKKDADLNNLRSGDSFQKLLRESEPSSGSSGV